MKHATSIAGEVVDDRNSTPAGSARTVPAGVLSSLSVAVMTGHVSATPGSARFAPSRWSRRVLDFLFGRGQRRFQSIAPIEDDGPSELYRCSIHEASHCLAARLNNTPVVSVTTVPNITLGYSGQALIGHGQPMARTMEEHETQTREIVSTVGMFMPAHGEDPDDAAPWFLSVHKRVTELLAGAAGEIIIFGRADDARSRSDYNIAWLKARSICSSEVSTEAFLEFALTEAIELIRPYRGVLAALAEELAARRDLIGAEVDQIICAALVRDDRDRELVRRADWSELTQRVAFQEDQAQ
jgi:hypothetical protein